MISRHELLYQHGKLRNDKRKVSHLPPLPLPCATTYPPNGCSLMNPSATALREMNP